MLGVVLDGAGSISWDAVSADEAVVGTRAMLSGRTVRSQVIGEIWRVHLAVYILCGVVPLLWALSRVRRQDTGTAH